MNSSREKILACIREALRVPAVERRHDNTSKSAAPGGFDACLPRGAESPREAIAQFAAFSKQLRTGFFEFGDDERAADHVHVMATQESWTRVAAHRGELVDKVLSHLPASISVLQTDGGYDRHELERCDAGITECECLIAQTGSVCVTSRSCGGRALSVLPPHHIVIARQTQVVPNLSAAYVYLARKYSNDWPSFVGFITGPSRTGDIERILVYGAHGPKQLTVLLVP